MQKNTDLIIYLIFIFSFVLLSLGILFLMLFLAYNKRIKQKHQELLRNLLLGQSNERARFARDLHDGLSPDLSSIIFLIDEIEIDDSEVIEIQKEAKLRLRNVIQSIRDISQDLMPEILGEHGFAYSIEKLIEANPANGIQINFINNLNEYKLNNDAEIHLYKITQELINNTQKHSKANAVTLNVNYYPLKNQLEYRYSDNGIGFDKNKNSDGTGLKNILTRAALINGVVSIDGSSCFKLSIVVDTK